MRILGVCGSISSQSANLDLLKKAHEIAPARVEVQIFGGIGALPWFNTDLERDGSLVPIEVRQWRHLLRDADALLIASPEYGHSLTGVLKNAIDWVIGTGELEQKIIGITASVPGRDRGLRGLEALRVTLGAVRANVVSLGPIVRGANADEALLVLLQAIQTQVSQTFPPE
jgi:chromate reductase, NAD(P)H dehydrogenase (quinone)